MFLRRKDRRQVFKAIALGVCFVFLFATINPKEAIASRSGAGGGDLAEVNWGNVAMSAGLAIGGMAIGGALNSALSATWSNAVNGTNLSLLSAMGDSLSKSMSLTGVLGGYNTFVATSQVGRAAMMMGSYYEWGNKTTYLVASVASGATAGFLNPSVTVGEGLYTGVDPGVVSRTVAETALPNMAKGAFVGSLSGLASGLTVTAIDGEKIAEGKSPGIGAQIAGLAAGTVAGNIGRKVVDYATYNYKSEGVYRQDQQVDNTNYNQGNYKNTSSPDVYNQQPQNYNQVDYAATTQSEYNNVTGWENDPASRPDFYYTQSGTGSSDSAYGSSGTTNIPSTTNSQNATYYQVTSTEPYSGRIHESQVSLSDVQQYNSSNYEFRPLGGGYVEVVNTNADVSPGEVTSRIFWDGAIVNTIDAWPQLATGALSIWATSTLGEKNQWLEPLVRGTVQGFAGPVFSSFARYYALQPSLYTSEGHLGRSVNYIDSIRQEAFASHMRDIGRSNYDVYKDARNNNLTPQQLADRLGDNARNYNLSTEIMPISSRDEELRYQTKNIESMAALRGMTEREQQVAIENMTERTNANDFNPLSATLGINQQREQIEVQARVKGVMNEGFDSVFNVTGTSRFSLFWDSASRGAMAGLIEGGISGGLASLGNKISENNIYAPLMAYGAAMIGGAVRGAIWHLAWEPSRNEYNDLVWMDRYTISTTFNKDMLSIANSQTIEEAHNVSNEELATLTSLAGSSGASRDWWQQKITEYTLPYERARFQQFARESGLSPQGYARVNGEWINVNDLKGNMDVPDVSDIEDIRSSYKLQFSADQRPSLGTSILVSLAQTNRDFLNNYLSFGLPQGDNISTYSMVNYLSNVNSFALSSGQAGWFTGAMNKSALDAGAGALSNNVMSSLASIKSTADLLGLQRQRLAVIPMKDTPLGQGTGLVGGVTALSLDYNPSFLSVNTQFYVPFPSDSFRTQFVTGDNFIDD